MKKILIYTLSVFFILSLSFSLKNCTEKDLEVEKKEKKEVKTTNKLVEVINNYRASKGLKKIPFSKSLTKVAELHVKDLVENHPNKKPCNLHSWSNKGKWKPCCYTPNHANAKCMWSKPRELTSYKGDGYEISAWSSTNITPERALSLWKASTGHHNLIVNKGIWKDEWKAIGAAIYKGHAAVWFGHENDTK